MTNTQIRNTVHQARPVRDKRPVWVIGIYLMAVAVITAIGLIYAISN